MKLKLRFPRLPLGDATRVFRNFAPHLRSHRRALSIGGLSLLGTALIELARPWPVKVIIDYILIPDQSTGNWEFLSFLEGMGNLEILGIVTFAMLLLAVLGGMFTYGQRILLTDVGHRVAGDIRVQLFTHIQQLPQSYHDYRQTGDLLMRLTGDINMLKDLLVSLVLKLGSRLLVVAGILVLMLKMDPMLTLIALIVIPALLAVNVRFSSRIKDASRRQRRKAGEMAASMHENLAGIGLVRAFTQERKQAKKFSKKVTSDVKAGLKITRLEVRYARTVEVVTALGMAAVLWFGVRRVLSGILSAGDLLILLSYMRTVYRPLRDVASQSARLAKAIASGQRILEILDMEPAVKDDPDALTANGIAGDIHFNNIAFGYKPGHTVLQSVSCHIPAGKTTLVIGRSGAGKSTLAKLLMRLYEPTSGQITVDGKDSREYRVRSLRKQITSLAQEVTMFQGTVRENIGFGNPRKGEDAIEAAARQVGADEFIAELPDGYETLVGEGGLTLSGGERQRLGFARAALRDSRIMIFDEPAAGLDPLAEREAKDALAALRDDRTIVIITHRLNFLNLADHVVYLQDGRVVDEGSVDVLRSRTGPFAEYLAHWREQIDIGTGSTKLTVKR